MLVRIDERVNAFGRQLERIDQTFQANMATKPELGAVTARVSRLEKMVYGVIASFIAMALATATSIIQRGAP